MKNLNRLISFFVAACLFVGVLAWWYRPASFQVIGLCLAAWFILGIASAAFELANMPTDSSVPNRYRIAGRIFRGVLAATVLLLVSAVLLSARHAS